MTKKALAVILSFVPLTFVLAQGTPQDEGSFVQGLLSFGALVIAMVGLIVVHRSWQAAEADRRSDRADS